MDRKLVMRRVAHAASYNVILQLCLRLLTFVLNGYLLRRISKDTIGIVNVRLTLLYTTCLFLSREGFRKACVSYGKDRWPVVANIVWLPVVVGIPCAAALYYVWTAVLEVPDDVPHYRDVVAMFALSAVVELAAEPAFIFCQANLLVGSRVLLEGIAQIVRTVATVTLVVHYPELGLLIFGATQLLAAVVLMVGYYASVQRHLTAQQDKALHIASIVELAPQPRAHAHAHAHATEARAVLARVASFVKNSFIKQLLTEGERYIMTIFNVVGFAEQGVFDVVANLGSLVARFLFLPIEENYYVFFSMLLGASVPREDAGRNAALAAHALAVLLKLGLLIGLTFVAFGPAYTHILLDLYGGRNLSAGIGPYLLAWYCVYVLAMALNGIGECFVTAASTPAQIDVYNRLMVVFSAIYVTAALALTRTSLHSAGFIAANCINMALRFAYAVVFMARYFGDHGLRAPWRDACPAVATLCAFAASAGVVRVSQARLAHGDNDDYGARAAHVGVGAACFLATAAVVYIREAAFRRDAVALWRGTLQPKAD